jgi:hypothetical protein
VEALTLERCETTEDPPKSPQEFVKHFLTDIKAGQERREAAAAEATEES